MYEQGITKQEVKWKQKTHPVTECHMIPSSADQQT